MGSSGLMGPMMTMGYMMGTVTVQLKHFSEPLRENRYGRCQMVPDNAHIYSLSDMSLQSLRVILKPIEIRGDAIGFSFPGCVHTQVNACEARCNFGREVASCTCSQFV